MNKTEKLISALLGVALVWCFMSGPGKKETPAEPAAAEALTNAPAAEASVPAAQTNAVPAEAAAQTKESASVSFEGKSVVLENSELKLEFSTRGAVLRKATLKQYGAKLGSTADDPLVIDYGEKPLGIVSGVPGLKEDAEYSVAEASSNSVVFAALGVTRRYTLEEGYKLSLEETFPESMRTGGALSLGSMSIREAQDDLVSVDSWAMNEKGGAVVHHGDDDSPLKALLTGSSSGGCGCGSARVDPTYPLSQKAAIPGAQNWVALKDRFFVTALASCDVANAGFEAEVSRVAESSVYRAKSVSARLTFASGAEKRVSSFYIGPKEQSRLWDLGMKDVMEFGMWRWVCYPILWLLKACHAVIPSYGIAIILLTILVRLVFWPLTRKSTEGMKKMQEIQPLLKEIQAKFKDNPQRLQQETFALYREKKVNPMSSCLPMLIQIPVFIALFNVLRSAVELRYAGFLWINDLSAPEHLCASWFPFGGLNILPILMAATMFLQSKLTPSMGDAKQQRMMTVMMPLMMLVMFYNFASALSLYWTLSQVMSIIQMWMIRRASAKKEAALTPEVIDPPSPTRQQRRHGSL